ncbi:MAG: N-acetyl-alpha-D-glucosaminyl L-malate synthase BshA [Candidatus Diapherotrites archaeon]|nr:N-acetyl-alpha-D-glucosaminyl L-malate synthase BshA [Candidatus Diapherotrites archaeon]
MKKKLHVGIVSFYNPHLGGSRVSATRTAIQLARRGHKTFIISHSDSYNTEALQELGLNFFPIESIEYPTLTSEVHTITFASKIAEVQQSFGLDLVHAHYGVPYAVSCMVAKELTSVPYFVTLRGSDVSVLGVNPAIQPVLNMALKKAEKVFFVSNFLKEFAANHGIYTKNSEVLYNFVPTDLYAHSSFPNLKKALKISPESTIVTHASNFREIKRPFDIIEAAKIVLDNHKNVYFIFIGEGPLLQECQRKVEELGISKNIRFTGRKENMYDWFAITDIFILNSEIEGFGLVVAEAMASGSAVISSKCGGPEEIIEENKSGLLFEREDIDALVEKISFLIENPGARKKMGQEAKNRIRKKFSAENHIPRLEAEYYKAIQTKEKD